MKTLSLFSLLFAANCLFGASPHVYVTDPDGSAVEIIDVATNTSQYIYGFDHPRVVVITSDGVEAYVGQDNGVIQVIDTSKHTVGTISAMVPQPIAMAITPDNQFLYVTSAENTVTVIRTSDRMIQTVITGFNDPEDIKIDSEATFAYVTNPPASTISVIETSSNTIVATIAIPGGSPTGLTLTNDGLFGYVTDPSNNCLYQIDLTTKTIVSTVYGFNAPKYMAMSANEPYAYITCTGDNTVIKMQISNNKIVSTFQVSNPRRIAVTPDGKFLYVGSPETIFKFRILSSTVFELSDALPGFANPSNLAVTVNNPPPSTLNGCRSTVSPGVFRNHVTWETADGNPIGYTIYRDASRASQLVTLPGTALEFYETNVLAEQSYWYYLVANYANGFSSTQGYIIVQPYRQCLNELN